MQTFSLLVVILLFVKQGRCIQNCYSCQSSISMEDCELQQRKELGCSNIRNETTMCYVIEQTRRDGRKVIGKHCIAESYCKKEKACDPRSVECKVYCCTEPLCNGARIVVPDTSTPEINMAKKLIWFLSQQKFKRAFRKMVLLDNRLNVKSYN